MSGTSLDGVDAVLARFDDDGKPEVLARAEQAFPAALRAEFLSLNQSGADELARSSLAANALCELYANAVEEVLRQSGLRREQISALGAHGQTVRHQPGLGYTIQINSPALLAELTQIDVIADFRSRDVAAGGQGAPLVPFFHAGVFKSESTRVVLNLGGIANITILTPGRDPIGFDTGPANVLMDEWCFKHTGQLFDRDGAWGATGQVHQRLLAHLIASEPWFSLPAPKSTGRDLFHRAWLESRLAEVERYQETTDPVAANDIQATLCALSAETVAQAIHAQAPDVAHLLVCGGGARNSLLLNELRLRLRCEVATTDSVGIGTQDVEALAFAWLAWAHQRQIPVSNPAVTGARGARILGATWPK
jgi:anhydro-N-acetylmuramic acid kinase